MANSEDPLIGKILSGCKILEKVGSGAMGTVYKAYHINLDKVVSIKTLSSKLARDEREVKFFLREAQSVAKIDHPNILHIYNAGFENDVYFLVMSYVRGTPLSSIAKPNNPLSLSKTLKVMVGVLRGLRTAHKEGIIHRDIKPSNILITDSFNPKIVDFGLAKPVHKEKDMTLKGETVGTAYFMSPEQALGKEVDERTDLYSLGIMLFYLLTGKYPFEGKNSIEVIHKHISDTPPDILKFNPNLPEWISELYNSFVQKNPDDRVQNADKAIKFIRQKIRETKKQSVDVNQSELEKLDRHLISHDLPQTSGSEPQKLEATQTNEEIIEKEIHLADIELKDSNTSKNSSLPLIYGFFATRIPKYKTSALGLTYFLLASLMSFLFLISGIIVSQKAFPPTRGVRLFFSPWPDFFAGKSGGEWIAMGFAVFTAIFFLIPKNKRFRCYAFLLLLVFLSYYSGLVGSIDFKPHGYILAGLANIFSNAFSNIVSSNSMFIYFCLALAASYFLLENKWNNLWMKISGACTALLSIFLLSRFCEIPYMIKSPAPVEYLKHLGMLFLILTFFLAFRERKSTYKPFYTGILISISALFFWIYFCSPYVDYVEKEINAKVQAFYRIRKNVTFYPVEVLMDFDKRDRTTKKLSPIPLKIYNPEISTHRIRFLSWKYALTQPWYRFQQMADRQGHYLIVSLLLLMIMTFAYFLNIRDIELSE
jgi:serine/threonine protein kinase